VAGALERLGAGEALVRLRLEGPAAEADLAELWDRSDRHTVFAVLAPDRALFLGFGINPGVLAKPIAFRDVWPTLAQIGEFYLAPGVSGAVLFEILKNPSFKQTQIAKLKAAVGRLEKILKRGDREPWDKHDCA
jgi:hypothetical protein